ncbi:MAG: glycosyltransferase [Clostridia bacterium]|nr:glycosyltransferase [Clostridia bacterium]
MNILQINAVNAIKSTGRTCLELSNYFNERGDHCVTAYSIGPSVNSENEFIIGSSFDRKVHALFSRLFGMQAYFSKGATRKLTRYMKKFSPQAVILRNFHSNYINLPMVLKFLAKNDIPTVAVLHDCWFYTGKCCHYTVDGCYKWKSGCGECKSLKKYNKSWFFDLTHKMVKDKEKYFSAVPRLGVVGVSDWLTNEAKAAPVFKKAKMIKRIYNWINLEKFKPVDSETLRKKLGLSDKKVILCVASLWSYDKGLRTVLKLSEKLSDDERIVMLGNVPSGAKLNDKIISLPATNSVDELIELYSMADVFFQPSLEETFGKVSAEALSCGTPVVCFNSTANPELVGKGCGKTVEVGDIDGASEAIKKILSEGKVAYSKVCREFAEENFDMRKNLSEYVKLFEELNS